MDPIKIYPNTNLHTEMPDHVEAVLDWFRSNKVDPRGVSGTELATIESDQIDCWWVTMPDTPEPADARAMERTFGASEFPRSHLQMPITVPLPPDLEAALREVQRRWDEREADLRRRFYGIAPCPKCGYEPE